ncbi:hypothetical protein P280DRAFT_516720 [Massarina eburnea CBS 473.64]|uniref:Uncharacterized protein n=1 Tax=Massarina eburnea CBS 473.64 TaxID=1395130 RepID=A0A6A6S2C6_9PLEO|nr:hypothetical protein P280DRAFT_516720 [Massarina eburnea CBS 473.64]
MSAKETFSAKEMQNLALAWQCMETEPKINMDKFAELAGYGSRASASVTFGNLKRKLKALADGNNFARTPVSTPKKSATSATTKTPRSGKRGPTAADNESPAKKKKGGNATSQKQTQHQSGDEYDGDHGKEGEELGGIRVKAEPDTKFLRGISEYGYDDNGSGAL